jgi:hypothetical protein
LKRSPKLLKTSVTGFARLIHRGGKPEFFCLTIINANSGDIDLSHSREEKYFTDFNHLNNIYGNIDLSPVKIVSSVKDFCNNNKEKISVPLELSLRFMADAIEENASTLFNTGEVH